jgi:hypothetical protein
MTKVRGSSYPSCESTSLRPPRRYAALFATTPTTAGDAIDLAMQYGKDIVDGKVQASGL